MKEQTTFEKVDHTNIHKEYVGDEEQEQTTSEKELSVSDVYSEGSYIANPEVGESVEFTIKKIVENPVTTGTVKATGEKFDIGCKKKDGTVIRRDIITADDERFTISSWQVFYLFFGKDSDFKKYIEEKGGWEGVKVRLTRNYNGKVPKQKVAEIQKLYDFETVEEAKSYQEEVATAFKEGRLYTLEILE